ncbi:Hypothetical_protein [Hexamita inflata]|uniref:Hypothetical_protein n=1 Tax=Hexamita inflata TaxID=28002 RepID=A0AA86UQG4_9EUKA|nr:Hypothetical protein HINF_LOCUS55320 [Hexamita inflata]
MITSSQSQKAVFISLAGQILHSRVLFTINTVQAFCLALGTNLYFKNCVKPVQNKYWRTSPYSLSRNFTGFKRGERLIPVVSFVMPISALQNAQTFDQYFGSNNLLLTTPKQHLTLQNFVEQFQDGYLTVSAAVFMDFDVGIDKPFILTSVVYGTFCFVFTALIKCFPKIGKKIIRVDFLFPKEPKVVRRQYLIM